MAGYKKSIFGVGLLVLLSATWMLIAGSGDPKPVVLSELAGVQMDPIPSMPQLSRWMENPSANLEKGMALAKERGRMMRELIRTHPEKAVSEALSISEWAALPDELKAYVEEPFSTVANVEVMIACGDKSSETFITTVFPDGREMETFVYGRRRGVGSKNSAPVQGIRLGGLGALREEIFQPLDEADEKTALNLFPVAAANPGGDSVATLAGGSLFYFKNRASFNEANARIAALEDLPGPDAGAQALFDVLDEGIDFETLEEIAFAASSEWTGTPRDMYVILVDFSDLPGQPTDPVAYSNSINTTVSQQIWDMSYEKTHVVCAVNPTTYRMADVSTSYADSGGSYPNAYRMYSNAIALVEADGINLSSCETICVYFAHINEVSYGGLATVGGYRMWINGTTSTKTLTHELGHNYGTRHADFWQATNGGPADPAGSEVSYGDFMDIMGSGSVPSGHFNVWHKRHLGWFEANHWLATTNSGIYRVYRSDHRETTGILRGLEIQKGGGDHYWVGLRQEQTSYETFSRGAYVVWKMAGDNESDLLDMTPLSAGGKYDGGLALGQTYSDVAAAVHITPAARGGQTPNEWMDIVVNLGSFPGNTAPIASLSGATNLSVSTSSRFTVTAFDADGDELAYYWDTGDGLVKPNSPSIATVWLSGSTVTVSCVVSDMKGGTHKVSQSVVLSSPLDNWTKRSSGVTTKLNDIAYGGDRLVAVGRDWKIVYSDDGTNWTVITKNNVYFAGVVHDGSQFVAAGFDHDSSDSTWKGTVFTSSDGTSWTRRFIDGQYLNDIAYSDGIYVAVGNNGTIIRSTDGINWSSVVSGISTDLKGVSYGDGVFVAVADEGSTTPHVVLSSTDGTSWVDHSAGTVMYSGNWLVAVEYCNDRFLAGGWNSEILYSTNQGDSFASAMSGSLNMEAFAFGNGTYFAAGVDLANLNADMNFISLDGVNWAEISTVSQDHRNAAVFYKGTFITVGDNGSIWQSNEVGSGGSGFALWQLENGAALGFNRDPLDDADFDGRLNLFEYALGSSATDAGSLPATATPKVSEDYFQISYDRDGIKSDIDYLVERSGNLVSNDWSTANTVVITNTAANLTVRSAIPIAVQTNEFMRLNIKLK